MIQTPGRSNGAELQPLEPQMNLPIELFNEITDSVTILGRDEPRAEDRRSPRVQLSSHLAVARWSEPTAPLSVRVRDMSLGGIGIFFSERVGLDEQLIIRLPRRDKETVAVLGTVVYWEPLVENLFGIGVEFARLIDEAEISRQSQGQIRRQINQIGMIGRVTQALARTWRIAS